MTTTTRRSPRYQIRADEMGRVILTSTDAAVLAALGEWEADSVTRIFTVTQGARGGYVHEGDQQVCEGLCKFGVTLLCRRANLAREIRREMRRALRWHAVETAPRWAR